MRLDPRPYTPCVPRYDLLAIDLDGTLLNSAGEVSPRNRDAVIAAREAGMLVVVCTGRGLVESQRALCAIDQREPVVVAGGAIIACPTNRRTLHRFPIDATLVATATAMLLDHGHAVLVLKDRLEVGYDYLVVQGPRGHSIDPVTAWWFAEMGAEVRYARSISEDEHPEHTVRVGACGPSTRFHAVRRQVADAFADRLIVQHFQAVTSRKHAKGLADHETLDVFEVFDARANKWSALMHLAALRGIEPTRICAIGDEINDEAMIRGAALGIAMGNACDSVRRAADRHVAHHDDDGVADAIDRILSGEW